MSDLDKIFDEESAEVETPEAQEEPVSAEAETPDAEETEVEQDEKSEPIEASQETKEEEPEVPDVDPKDIPYPVFKSIRDDLKDEKQRSDVLQRELDEIKRQLASQTKPPEPVKAPDIFENPEEYQRYADQRIQQVQQSTRFDMSEVMATESYGEEVVNAAFEAVKAAGPTVAAQFMNARHPYGDMVKWHKQQQAINEIGDDPTAYRDRIEAEIRQKIEAEMAAKQATEMAAQAAPSMATVNGTGGNRSTKGYQGPTPLDAMFGD